MEILTKSIFVTSAEEPNKNNWFLYNNLNTFFRDLNATRYIYKKKNMLEYVISHSLI